MPLVLGQWTSHCNSLSDCSGDRKRRGLAPAHPILEWGGGLGGAGLDTQGMSPHSVLNTFSLSSRVGCVNETCGRTRSHSTRKPNNPPRYITGGSARSLQTLPEKRRTSSFPDFLPLSVTPASCQTHPAKTQRVFPNNTRSTLVSRWLF